MRKFLLILCSAFLLSGCTAKVTENPANESVIGVTTEEITEKETEVPTESVTAPAFVEISDNINFYDLTLLQNSDYRKDIKSFTYGSEYEMSDYGKIIEENGNIFLEKISGERTPLIDLPIESETVYVTISCIIDDSRFAYLIHQEDANLGSGIYDLASGEDFRIENKPHSGYCPEKVSGDKLILTRGFIAEFHGYSILDLNTYELTDLDSSFVTNERRYTIGTRISDNEIIGAAVTLSNKKKDSCEYTVTLYSLGNEEVVDEFTFDSESSYLNFYLEFTEDDKLYVYAMQEGEADKGYNYLYAIDVPTIPESDNRYISYQ